MHFSSFILGATFILTGVLAKLPETPCTPHADHETCLLYWVTNTGIDKNLDDPADIVAYAHATIYSPSCMPWGATTNGLAFNVKVYAWGLSYTDPLELSPASVPGLGYNTPQFKYNGQVWGYEDCECENGNLEQQTHICKCPFQCEHEPVIG
jgi:hypothetical protein